MERNSIKGMERNYFNREVELTNKNHGLTEEKK